MDIELVGGPCSFRDHAKIRIIGNKKDVETAAVAVKAITGIDQLPESKARLEIQKVIDEQGLKASILFDGNTVYSMTRIITNLNQIMQHGTLYDGRHPGYVAVGSMLRFPIVDKCILSDYFYHFLSLDCGSIAHYNKAGWVTIYPTIEDLKAFFKKNEFGHRVLDDIPWWKTDAKRIVEAIEARLFPLESITKQQ
jgi:hypothetical protein